MNPTSPISTTRPIAFEILYTLVDWNKPFSTAIRHKEFEAASIKGGLVTACKHLANVATKLKKRQLCVVFIWARKADGSLYTNRLWRPRNDARRKPGLFRRLSPSQTLVRGYGPAACRQIEKPIFKKSRRSHSSLPTA